MSGLTTALTAIWAALHTLQYGFGISALNGVQDALSCQAPGSGGHVGVHSLSVASGVEEDRWGLKACVPMTSTQFGLVVAIFTLGGLIGSLSATAITDRVGRVWTLRLSALGVLIGNAAVGLANTFPAMMVGRIFIGLGSGLATVTVPLYLAEIAPPAIKRSLGIMTQFFIVIGLLIGQSLSFPFAEPFKWRYVLTIGVGIAVVQLIGSLFVPQPDKEESGDGDEEAPLLPDARESALTIPQLLFSKDLAVARGLVVVFITQLIQQFCGISPVMYFSTRIMTPVFQANSKYIALAIVLLKIPVTLIPAFIIERIGSKRILLFSALIMSLAGLLLGFALNTDAQALSVISILLFVSAFSIGLGPVTWVVIAEVMPKHATTAAGSVGLFINFSTNFIMGASFLPLQQWLAGVFPSGSGEGEGNVFFLFAVTCLIGFGAIKWSYERREKVDEE